MSLLLVKELPWELCVKEGHPRQDEIRTRDTRTFVRCSAHWATRQVTSLTLHIYYIINFFNFQIYDFFWIIGLKPAYRVKVIQIMQVLGGLWLAPSGKEKILTQDIFSKVALHSIAIVQSVCRLEDFKVVSERKPSAQSIRPNGRFS